MPKKRYHCRVTTLRERDRGRIVDITRTFRVTCFSDDVANGEWCEALYDAGIDPWGTEIVDGILRVTRGERIMLSQNALAVAHIERLCGKEDHDGRDAVD